jgi:glycosyltransferase involved in cell wall biosynthesis
MRQATMITVIIPSYNEEKVISRTLKTMTAGALPGELDVIVVCNGCTDDTVSVAGNFGPPVRVIGTGLAGKTVALNLGDKAATSFPRVYADADVHLTIDAIRNLANRLETGDVLAVAPIANIDLKDCSWLVRTYYEIRSLLPSGREGIGGSGVYALSEAGRSRFSEFPKLTADDGYVRIQFKPEERETLTSVSSTVFAPRTVWDLITTKTRSQYGSLELASRFPALWKNKGDSNDAALVELFRHPLLWHKLLVYCLVTIIAKRRARIRMLTGNPAWLRDETSRVAAE